LRLRLPRRFVATLLIVCLVKVAASAALFQYMNVQSSGTYWMDANKVPDLPQNMILLEDADMNNAWLFLFQGWDSAWYVSIAARGYFSNQSFAFLPGFPLLGSTFNILLSDPIGALTLCSALFGVLWVPVYQAIAERHMGRRAAVLSALLFAFSPFVLLFSTVTYSEGLFLFLTLTSWYLFEEGKTMHAAALASFSAVVRWVGVLMIIPMLLTSISRKGSNRFRDAFISLLPLASVFAWFWYCQAASGDWLVSAHTTEWSTMATFRVYIMDLLPKQGLQALMFSDPYIPQSFLSPILTWILIFVSPFLIYRLRKLDRSLAVYSSAYYIGVLSFGTVLSFSRFISFLFPIWLQDISRLQDKKWFIPAFALILMSFLATGFYLLASFLSGVFVG